MKFLLILSLLIYLPLFSSVNITVFAAADNSMYDILNNNIIEMRNGTADNDAIINILTDTPEGAYHIVIAEGIADTLSYQANINAGDPKTVSDFLINSFNNFPTDRFITVLWDHGSGWYESKSILYDNNPDDFISVVNGELADIFREFTAYTGKKVDLLIFDACDMHSIEVLFEIRDYVDYSLGSCIRMLYSGMPYSDMVGYLSSMDVEDAGRSIADNYFSLYTDSIDSLQVSLIDLDCMDYIAEQMQYIDLNAMERINTVDMSIPDSLISDYIYNVSDKEYISGLKMFNPAHYNVFLMLFRDYLELEYQKQTDILARIFSAYNIRDTLYPEHIDSIDVRPAAYSNMEISFENAYDFTGIAFYIINALLIEDSVMYSFDDIACTEWGVLSDEYFISKPYSVYTDTFNLETIDSNDFHIIELNIKGYNGDGIFIINTDWSSDSFRFRQYDEWSANVFKIRGINPAFYYSGNGDHIFIDNICIISGNQLWEENAYTDEHIMHKLPIGDYSLFIEAEDREGNRGSITGFSHFSVLDSLTPYVYPNPASNEINIVTDIRGEYTLSVYSSAGHLILEEQGLTDNGIVNVDIYRYNPGNGMYFFTINGRRGKFAIVYD